MLYWAIVFFIIAAVAAIFGFGGIASASAGNRADPVRRIRGAFRHRSYRTSYAKIGWPTSEIENAACRKKQVVFPNSRYQFKQFSAFL